MTMTRARPPRIGAGEIAQKPKNRGVYVFFIKKYPIGLVMGLAQKCKVNIMQYKIIQDRR